MNVETIPSGAYKVEVPDDGQYYQSDIEIRPFMQRYMYKRFIKGNDSTPNRYVKQLCLTTLTLI